MSGARLALILAAAAACGGRGPSGDVITLRVMNWATDLELEGEQRIADRFAASRPGLRVIVESIATNYGEKLVTAIASGVPPDVFLLDAPDIPAFVERGLVLDLAPYSARVGYDTMRVFPEVLDLFRRGREFYAFPKGFSPIVVYYNRALFDSLGVEQPRADDWTFDEFLATAKAVTRDADADGRTDIYGVNFPRQLYEWVPWVWSGGGDILDSAGQRTVGALDSEATIGVFRYLTDLVLEHRVAPPVQFLQTGDPMRVARFYMGAQGMLVSGHWHMPRLRSYAERGDLDIGVAPIPHRAGVPPQTVIYAAGWAVPANVRHKRQAVELAAYLAGEEAQRLRAAAGLEIPALADVAREVAQRDTTGVESRFLAIVPQGRPTWGATVADFHEIERVATDIMDRRLLEGDSLAVAAREVARAIDRVITR
jgi:multiple sugar transport system substrate-binding protein